MRKNLAAAAATIVACGALCNIGFAQSVVNGNFEAGTLNGWTVTPTPGGVTNVQTVEVFNIDGRGPLPPSNAAKFSVGRQTAGEVQEGINLLQSVDLVGGVTYEMSFNWAVDFPYGTSNGEGGVFSIVVDGGIIASEAAGEITQVTKHGFVIGQFTPSQSGPHNLGVRITRPYTIPTTLTIFQYVDNINLTTLVTGSCCLQDGTCQDVTAGACNGMGGVYRGDSTTCATMPACPVGACCLVDGTCELIAPTGCAEHGGTYSGDGTTCGTIPPCPLPPTGACCLNDGTCITEWVGACLAQGGRYQGDNVPCGACSYGLVTSYEGNFNAVTANAGAFFELWALDPAGVVVESLAINTPAPVGTPMTVHVYYKLGNYEGFETNAAAWTLLGEVQTVAAGVGNPTPVAVGGLHVAYGENVSLRVGAVNGGIRFTNQWNAFANEHAYILMGKVQAGLFTGTLSSPRVWNGTVFYTLGASVVTGACCLPDGTCGQRREVICIGQGGIFHGDNVPCSALPPGTCPQPGACCFGAHPCQILSQGQCAVQGGMYMGNSTPCESCPAPLPGSVLLVAADSATNVANVQHALLGTGLLSEVVTYPATSATPLLSELLNYDAVLTWANQSYLSGEDLGNVLADYVDAGGGVVVTVHALSSTTANRYLTGRWASGGYNILPTQSGLASGAATLGTVHLPSHPIWEGISGITFVSTSRAATTTVPPSAVRIADWSDGRPLALASTQMPRRVDLNLFPGGNHASVGAMRVVGNAIRHAGGLTSCYANCDNSTTPPILNVEDFSCFINAFAAATLLPPAQQLTHYANCDSSTTPPVLNVEDFSCFINAFAAGCP
jgi:hypothetical protein